MRPGESSRMWEERDFFLAELFGLGPYEPDPEPEDWNCKYHKFIYLECALEKTDGNPESPTYTYHHHNAFSIRYYVHCSYCRAIVSAVIRIV
ncbi:hypothetical protein G5I_08440 [Acromyrmex echinatior]|uniref:Uncharacterized protein n=1 Tax=Acromyrmex echinatior TaxID=103372 RepID=F4WRJ0_ACREC|nr:hypothetical protein G5I_08440 [Acromyrmex echinatior]